MFGQWRLTLRQAEEAARAERFEEALELAARPDVASRFQANKLRNRIALLLIKRAEQHVRSGQSQAAWDDLRAAERAGAPRDKVAVVRGELAERGAKDVLAALNAGDSAQAVAISDDLRNRGAESSDLRRLHDAALCWVRADRLASVGDFARAIESMQTAKNHLARSAILDERIKLMESTRDQAATIRGNLQNALALQNWAEVLRLSDLYLDLAPNCREVKQARDESLRRLGVRIMSATNASPSGVGDETSPARGLREPTAALRSRFILWVDGVGGFLACPANVVTIGQASPATTVDIPILGDLSRQHATIVRDGEGYFIRSDRDLEVNGRPTRQVALRHQDVIRLGRSVDLRFTTPCPISGTARLDLISRHRLHLSLTGILLMADTCVIGPSRQTHVQVPSGSAQIVIYRQGEGLYCRGAGVLEIDGQAHESRGALRWTSRLTSGDVSLSLEPLGSPLSQV
jgi:tetratricopeptide (TPR) repeat protein